MPRPLQTVSQSDYSIQVVDTNKHTEWQTVQIQISWLLKKQTDLDLHCLQRLVSAGPGLTLLAIQVSLVTLETISLYFFLFSTAPDKLHIIPRKHMLWILIRSTSVLWKELVRLWIISPSYYNRISLPPLCLSQITPLKRKSAPCFNMKI